MKLTNNLHVSQMTEDTRAVVNVACQKSEEDSKVTRWSQNAKQSDIMRKDSSRCDEDNNDSQKMSNMENTRIEGFDTLNKTITILRNVIFVLVTVFSLSILLTEGGNCISK